MPHPTESYEKRGVFHAVALVEAVHTFAFDGYLCVYSNEDGFTNVYIIILSIRKIAVLGLIGCWISYTTSVRGNQSADVLKASGFAQWIYSIANWFGLIYDGQCNLLHRECIQQCLDKYESLLQL